MTPPSRSNLASVARAVNQRFWLTTHWPPRKGDGQALNTSIWLPNGRHHHGARVQPGDLVAIYEARSGRDAIERKVDGREIRRRCIRGREGVIALVEVTGPVVEDASTPVEHYADGSAIQWSWSAPGRLLTQSGFISRQSLNALLGFKQNYNFRGFGTNSSGLRELDGVTFEAIRTAFCAGLLPSLPNRRSPRGTPGGRVGGEEGPVHQYLKTHVAEDPAGVLQEAGLSLLKVEYDFGTGDRADILLIDRYNCVVGVEIEPEVGENEDVGVLQAIKYARMAEWATDRARGDSRAFLVATSIAPEMKARCRAYGVECFEVPYRREK